MNAKWTSDDVPGQQGRGRRLAFRLLTNP